MNALEVFQSNRPLLFSIAYRMLGSATEAEDVVQEAFLRYQAAGETVRSPRAFLSTVVTRLCLDALKSARAAREEYIGPWLPEPLLTTGGDLPLERAEQRESISIAFLVLLERLTPQERAVFVLREVFEFEYAEIAEMIGASTAACRQLFHRAQTHLADGRARFTASPEAHRRLVERFFVAVQAGDLNGLTALLASDVANVSDGGGKVRAARNIVRGADNVARLLIGTTRKLPDGAWAQPAEINGLPALLLWQGQQLLSVSAYHVVGDAIQTVYLVMNPDKLAFIARQCLGRVLSAEF